MVPDLGPTGNSGFDGRPERIIGNAVLQGIAEARHIRAGTDKTEIAFQDVPQLGKLIQAPPTDKSSDPREPGIPLFGPPRITGGLTFPAHGSKLEKLEHPLILSQAFLPEERRPS